jgi:hypothetical protein
MMELTWYVVGVLAGVSGYLVYMLSRKYSLGVIGLGSLITVCF